MSPYLHPKHGWEMPRANAVSQHRATHEEWRRVPVSPYRNYEISSLGRVRRNGKVLALVGDGDGYRTVKLSFAGLPKRFRVNRLVCEAFHGQPPAYADAAHEDGDRSNNRADNLAWKTRKSNLEDKRLHGTHQAGEKNGNAKITAQDVADIRARRETGETLRSLGSAYGLSNVQILRITRGDRW